MKPRKGEGGAWVVDVDGLEYSWTRWGAERSLDVLAELSDIVGGPLAGIFANLKQGLKTEITADIASVVLGGLTSKFRSNKREVISILKALSSGQDVFCAGKPVSFDSHYENRLDHLFRVAYAGLEVQYGSFFDIARGLLERAGIKVGGDLTPASATSTG